MLNNPIKNNISTNKDAFMCVGSCEKYHGQLSEFVPLLEPILSFKCSSVEGGFTLRVNSQ